jgi:hypothetical protein
VTRTTPEEQRLALLNAYRGAYRAVYGEEQYAHTEIWWERGYFYIWPAVKDEHGWKHVHERPYAMRMRAFQVQTNELVRKQQETKKGKATP